MAIGITISSNEGGGDFTPIVKYDARAGRAFRVDRRQDSSGAYQTDVVDITRTFKAVFDFENLEHGYIEFPAGAAPVFAVKRLADNGPMPSKPTDRAKQGVRLTIMLAKECGGEQPLREMAGISAAFLRGIDSVHDAYEQAKGKNPSKLPIIVLKDTIGVKTGSGEKQSTNYQPVFEIVGWTQRPDKLVWKPKGGATQGQAGSPISRPAPPATGSTLAAPPAAKQPELAMADDEDFG